MDNSKGDGGGRKGRVTTLSVKGKHLRRKSEMDSRRQSETQDSAIAGTSDHPPQTKRRRFATEDNSSVESDEDTQPEIIVISSSEDEETQTDQDDDSITLFNIKEVRQNPVKKFNTNQVTMTATPNRDADVTDHDSIMLMLNGMFEGMINHVGKNLKSDEDKMRIVVNSDRLDRPVSTCLVNKSQMTPELILSEVERVTQSHEDFVIDDSFFVNLVSVQMPEKGSGYHSFFCNIDKFLQNKTCIIQIKNEDTLCCGRALVVARERLEKENDPRVQSRWNSVRQGCRIQSVLAEELYESAGVAKGPCGLPELQKFQELLSDYQIIVVSAKELNRVVFKGPSKEKRLLLYLIRGHYHVITSLPAFFERSYYCYDCNRGYNDRRKHKCENICKLCGKANCPPRNEWTYCADCNRNFQSQQCHDNHKTPGDANNSQTMCNYKVRCAKCLKVYCRDQKKKHECFTRECRHCFETVGDDHLCYIQKIPRKKEKPEKDKDLAERLRKEHERREVVIADDAQLLEEDCKKGRLQRVDLDNGESVYGIVVETEQDFQRHFGTRTAKINRPKRGKKTREQTEQEEDADSEGDSDDEEEYNEDPNVIYSFDFECEQSSGEHKVICAVVKCEHDKGVIIFRGLESCNLFCRWLFDGCHEDSTFMAHNLRGYDSHFIINYLLDNVVVPTVIYNGAKIMAMQIPQMNIKFIDSFNFLPMALAKFPKTFGFEDISKGYFPHLFVSTETMNYRGPIPDLHYYDVDSMSPEKREQCMAFHAEKVAEGYVFDVVVDNTKYCVTDVLVMERGILAFRDIFWRTTNINPFDKAITIASACSQVFRTNHLERNTLAIVPAMGYHHRQLQSKEAIDWLNFVAFRDNVSIQHVNNGGEKKVCGRKVDGFCEETNTVYEYNGCFYHGCQKCFKPHTVNPVNDTAMIELYADTLRKKKMIRTAGFVYVEMWSHEFQEIRKSDPRYDDYRKNCPRPCETPAERDGISFLNARDAFYGGRTNATRLYYKADEAADEKLNHEDFTSLYPCINKYGKYPTHHPKIIVENFDELSNYFGVVKCKVLPPRKLYHPVLPDRVGNKLMFHLCRKCAETRQQTPCLHSDDERAFVGTWATVELELAVQKNYKIVQMYEVHHFEHSSKELFRGYIDAFLKIKQEASGWPLWVIEAEDRPAAEQRYLQEYEMNEGIKLTRANIEVNPGFRALAKLMLNSFWGKFGQRNNFPQTRFITSPDEFFGLLGSTDHVVNNIHCVNEEVVEVEYVHKKELIPEASNTNIYIAIFTTAMARIKLYESLDRLGDAVLYYDTDSIIYRCDGDNHLPRGDYLGDFTNEVEGNGGYITEFCSGGPKNYSYVTADGTTVTKVRGFTLNFKNQKLINFPVMKGMVVSDSPESVDVVNDHKIVRDKKSKKVLSKREVKKYRLVYDKRVIQEDFNTLPYGY
ncbi:hypothetical protein Bbelb_283260 [Branchiostoma belcheri]|nr:hypothetical protein Bbelb_283260 [Branchiostoma belcheri]